MKSYIAAVMFPDVHSMLDISDDDDDDGNRDLIVHVEEEADGLGGFMVHHFMGEALRYSTSLHFQSKTKFQPSIL